MKLIVIMITMLSPLLPWCYSTANNDDDDDECDPVIIIIIYGDNRQ